LLVVTACSVARRHWQAARAADSIPAYAKFLSQFQKGPYAESARARLDEWQSIALAYEIDTLCRAYEVVCDGRVIHAAVEAATLGSLFSGTTLLEELSKFEAQAEKAHASFVVGKSMLTNMHRSANFARTYVALDTTMSDLSRAVPVYMEIIHYGHLLYMSVQDWTDLAKRISSESGQKAFWMLGDSLEDESNCFVNEMERVGISSGLAREVRQSATLGFWSRDQYIANVYFPPRRDTLFPLVQRQIQSAMRPLIQ
jgi:hypothetical protein